MKIQYLIVSGKNSTDMLARELRKVCKIGQKSEPAVVGRTISKLKARGKKPFDTSHSAFD